VKQELLAAPQAEAEVTGATHDAARDLSQEPLPVPGRPPGPAAPSTVPGRATSLAVGAIATGSGAGAPLDGDTRAAMETAFATDFSSVRIHQDSAAAALGAIAFARGDDLHFAPGTYDPRSTSGRELLGHELAHVVQQRQGRSPVPGRNGLAIDPALEAEADDHGRRAARGEIVATRPTAARTPSGTAAQPKLGFEIEVNVLVSRKVGITQDEPRDELPIGKPGDIRWVNSRGYRWRDKLTDQDKSEDVAVPKDYPGSGGWVHWKEWGNRGTTSTDEDEYCDPMMSKESFYRGAAVQAKVDHAPSLSEVGARQRHAIVELVTDAREESAPDFLEPMKEALMLAGRIQKQVIDANDRVPVRDVLGSTVDDQLYLGARLGRDERQFQNLSGYVQATFGLRLGSVTSFMQQRTKEHTSSRDGEVYACTLTAMASLDEILGKLGISQKLTPHLYGYLALTCLYLVGGSMLNSGVGKNAMPLLVRERFDAVRSATVPAEQSKLLESKDAMIALHDAILAATRRGGGEPLYKSRMGK